MRPGAMRNPRAIPRLRPRRRHDARRGIAVPGRRRPRHGRDPGRAAMRVAVAAGGRIAGRQRPIQSDGDSRSARHAAQARARQLEPAALSARRADGRCGHRGRIPGPAARHRQSGSAFLADRGHGQESAVRRADGGANRLEQRGNRACARRNLQALRPLRHRDGARSFVLGGFRGLCGAFVRAGRAAPGDEGQTPGGGDFGSAQILPGPGHPPTEASRAGRRAASCGTLTGQTSRGPAHAVRSQSRVAMNRVIAVANQKGGVGKTTTAVHLAASLTATKRRVLLIDLDPQGNATMGCGIDKYSQARTSCDVLLGDCAAVEALVPVEYGGFMLMPSNQDLTAAEVRLLGMITGREFKLRNALKPVRENFDVIFIDCPPSLNMLTLNALVAADSVMVPMQCEYYALEGLSSLIQTIDQIRGSINSELQIEGLLRTMFDPRNNLSNEVSAQLIEHFGDKVFRTMIPRNVRLAEAPSFGKPALFHDKESRGALAYLALAGEMIRRDDLPPADETIRRDDLPPAPV